MFPEKIKLKFLKEIFQFNENIFPGSDFTMECDMAIIAIGLKANQILTKATPELKIDKYADVVVDPETRNLSIFGSKTDPEKETVLVVPLVSELTESASPPMFPTS